MCKLNAEKVIKKKEMEMENEWSKRFRELLELYVVAFVIALVAWHFGRMLCQC